MSVEVLSFGELIFPFHAVWVLARGVRTTIERVNLCNAREQAVSGHGSAPDRPRHTHGDTPEMANRCPERGRVRRTGLARASRWRDEPGSPERFAGRGRRLEQPGAQRLDLRRAPQFGQRELAKQIDQFVGEAVYEQTKGVGQGAVAAQPSGSPRFWSATICRAGS